MERRFTVLSATELVNKLRDGEWFVTGGHLARDLGFSVKLPILAVRPCENGLLFETEQRNFEVPIDNIVFTEPWNIEIRHTFMVKQQRKKIAGGGWREVPTVGAALRLLNPKLEETIRHEHAQREWRNEEERNRRVASRLNVRRERFVNSINAEFASKKLIGIEVVDERKLQLLFEDNSTIKIGSNIGDCCGNNCGSAVVNGISLQVFRRASYV